MREIERINPGEETDTAFAVVTRGLKPRLRGIPDVVAVVAAVPAAALLIAYARAGVSTRAAVTYGICLVLLFAISATYHTPHWPLEVRRFWRRLDHSAIYVMLVGCYSPVALVVVPESASWVLPCVYTFAALGLVKSFVWERSPRWLNTTIYVLLGYFITPLIPDLYARAGGANLALWAAGGVFYSIGAVIYLRRKPNPWPSIFGYHEVFHVFVVLAGTCHFIAFWRVLV